MEILCPTRAHVGCSEEGNSRGEDTSKHARTYAAMRIDINKNAANTAYTGVLYIRLEVSGNSTSKYPWSWSGKSTTNVYLNGTLFGSYNTTFPLSGTTDITDWYVVDLGTLRPNSSGKVVITAEVLFGPGIDCYGGGDFTGFYFDNWDLEIEDNLPLTQPPVIDSLKNIDPYNGNESISCFTDRVDIYAHCNYSGSTTEVIRGQYSIDGGTTWINNPNIGDTVSVTGLSAGTTYNIKIRLSNSAGWGQPKTITIRTRHAAPVLAVSLNQTKLEDIIFNWSSDKKLASLYYSTDGGSSWVNANQSGTSGTITLTRLAPNTTYNIKIKGTSHSDYDSVNSENNPSSNGTTKAIANITAIGTIIFGDSFTVTTNNPSGNTLSLKLWTSGNGRTAEKTVTVTGGSNTITFNQSDLDNIYKTFPNSNTITLNLRLTTKGSYGTDYNDTDKTKTITLTGKMKTTHVGVNNAPRRVQVWIGDSSNTPRRAVTWVGAGGGTKRTI